MGYVMSIRGDDGVTLSSAVVRRLIGGGSSDAALMYIFIASSRGGVSADEICSALKWTQEREAAAEKALNDMKLIGGEKKADAPAVEAPERSCPEYSRTELARTMETDRDFDLLRREVADKLGKILSDSDLNILMGLYDFLGLPTDVIFLLVNHCVQRTTAAYGEGRRPTMKQIEKEGYRWAEKEIFTGEAASKYLKEYAKTRGKIPQLMQVMKLGSRSPVQSEEKYLAQWIEWGFSPEAVELAYDRTIYHCQKLKWPYMNSILKSWHKVGAHSLADAKAADEKGEKKVAAAVAKPAAAAAEDRESAEWMRKYLAEKRKQNTKGGE